jgi:hypothetical protein
MYVHSRASFLQWNRESPWLALNQCIAREEWTRPTHSWIAVRRARDHRVPVAAISELAVRQPPPNDLYKAMSASAESRAL